MTSSEFNIINAIGVSISIDLRVNWPSGINTIAPYKMVVANNTVAMFYYTLLDTRALVWTGSGFIPIGGLSNNVIPGWGGSLKEVYLYGGSSGTWPVYEASSQSQITPEGSTVPAGALRVQIQSNSVDTQPITISSGYIRMDVVYRR